MNQVALFNQPVLASEASFEMLFKKWYGPLCKTIFRVVADKQVAEDIAQDAFVLVWEKREEITISVKSYLYKTAIHKAFTFLEKNKRYVRTNLEDEGFEFVPSANTTEEELLGKEFQDQVSTALDYLPPACRTVFLLSRNDELSYKEISDALGISMKTVENQMSKALKLLRERLLGVIWLVLIGWM